MAAMKRAFAGSTLAAFALFVACGDFSGDQSDGADAGSDTAVVADAGEDVATLDAAVVDVASSDAGCTSEMPFLEVAPMGAPINTVVHEYIARFTPDELHVFLGKSDGSYDYIARHDRASLEAGWGPEQILFYGAGAHFSGPWVAPAGDRFYYTVYSDSPAQLSVYNLDSGIGGPLLGVDDGNYYTDIDAYLSPDERDLYFASGRNNADYDLWHATADGDGGFRDAGVLNAVNTSTLDRYPVISADGLALYWGSESGRPAKYPGVYMATRTSRAEDFGAARMPSGLDSLQRTEPPTLAMPTWISPDNCRLYVATTRDGSYDIYLARRR
jgi:hypothetical protein